MIKKLASCFTYIICAIFVFFLLSFLSSGKNTTAPSSTSTPCATLFPDATCEDAALYYGDLFGDTYMDTQKAQIIEQATNNARSLNINAHYTGSTDDGTCVRNCVKYMLSVLSSMENQSGDFDNIQFVITSAGYIDKYGNSATPIVMTACIYRETMEKINYEYFLSAIYSSTRHPLEAFDSYYVHDVISSGVY